MAYRIPIARNATLACDGSIQAVDVLPQSWGRISAQHPVNFVRFIDEIWHPYDMLYHVDLDGESTHFIVSAGNFHSTTVVDGEVVLAFARDYASNELAQGHRHAAAAMLDMLDSLVHDHMYSPEVIEAFRSWFASLAAHAPDPVPHHNVQEDELCS